MVIMVLAPFLKTGIIIMLMKIIVKTATVGKRILKDPKVPTIVASRASRGLDAKNKFFLVGNVPNPFNVFCKNGYAPVVLT